jgi:hypothetical protein
MIKIINVSVNNTTGKITLFINSGSSGQSFVFFTTYLDPSWQTKFKNQYMNSKNENTVTGKKT